MEGSNLAYLKVFTYQHPIVTTLERVKSGRQFQKVKILY